MAVTGLLVFAGHNHLRYRITSDSEGGTLNITSNGSASPDLLTDTAALAGPLNKAARQNANGYGQVPAGAVLATTAQNIWLSDAIHGTSPNANPIASTGGHVPVIPTMKCEITHRDAPTADITIDANGAGSPGAQLVVTCSAVACVFYLDVDVIDGPSAGIGA